MATFHFFYYTEIDYVKLDLLKMSDTANAGPSENFLIVDHPKEDHNEWEFKRLIIGRTLNQLEKSCKTREVSYKWSTIKYNSINTWLSQNILRNNSSIQMWSTSKDWKTGGPQLKIEDQIMAYRWTFGKDNLNLEKFCERCTIKYDIIDYDGSSEKVLYRNRWKLSALIENYIMEGIRLWNRFDRT